MNRAFIVHGWGGWPGEGWFPWLKKELEARGFAVFVPQLPDTDNPRIQNWVPALSKTVGQARKDDYFVGHSMGCQTIARYLETLPEGAKVGGVVFVAGFFKRLTGLEDDAAVKETDRHWFGTPLDLAKVKSHLLKSAAIFSDDDPYVPLDNQEEYRDQLGSEITIEHNKKHFSGGEGFTELPIALEKVLEFAK